MGTSSAPDIRRRRHQARLGTLAAKNLERPNSFQGGAKSRVSSKNCLLRINGLGLWSTFAKLGLEDIFPERNVMVGLKDIARRLRTWACREPAVTLHGVSTKGRPSPQPFSELRMLITGQEMEANS